MKERAMYHINNDESDIFKLHPSKHYIPIIPNQPNFDSDMNHYLERSNQHKKQNNNIPKEQPIAPQQHKHFFLFLVHFLNFYILNIKNTDIEDIIIIDTKDIIIIDIIIINNLIPRKKIIKLYFNLLQELSGEIFLIFLL